MTDKSELYMFEFDIKEPPNDLFLKIIARIGREKEIKQTRKLILFAIPFVFSLILLPFSWNYFWTEIKNSGIFYFFETLFTNLSLVLTYWKDFVFAILESLPILAIVAFIVNLLFSFSLAYLVFYQYQRKKIMLKGR
jgi:ABC-type multidrug transport system permease subunit